MLSEFIQFENAQNVLADALVCQLSHCECCHTVACASENSNWARILFLPLIPVKTVIQKYQQLNWIPAFVGMRMMCILGQLRNVRTPQH